MKRSLLLLVLVAACSSAPSVTPPDGGLGGAGGSPMSSSSEAASTASSSSGAPEQDAAPVCSFCAAALDGPDPLKAAQTLCPAVASTWKDFLECACMFGKSCWMVCEAPLSWCAGLYPDPIGPYVPPDAACAACITATGPTGCGDIRAACEAF